MRLRSKLKDSRAFTLLELSVALLVFFIGILGLLQLIVITINSNQRNRDIALATSLAQQKLDQLLRPEIIWTSAPLNRGGIIPNSPNSNPFAATNTAPVSGYVEFFQYNGTAVSPYTPPSAGTSITAPPNTTYFIRQWQVCDGCGGVTDRCSPTSTACTPSPVLKKITVTVTALSPTLRNNLPSVTISAYRSRIG